jgi:hypothetical protein
MPVFIRKGLNKTELRRILDMERAVTHLTQEEAEIVYRTISIDPTRKAINAVEGFIVPRKIFSNRTSFYLDMVLFGDASILVQNVNTIDAVISRGPDAMEYIAAVLGVGKKDLKGCFNLGRR